MTIPENLKNVFVEPDERKNFLHTYYKLYHNCIGPSPSGIIELMEYGEPTDEEFLSVDEDSFLFLYDIFSRNIPDFSEYDYWNPIKPEV